MLNQRVKNNEKERSLRALLFACYKICLIGEVGFVFAGIGRFGR